ncbi:MAG TPA: penicillin-binding protein 2 [Aliidongia sp.]|nr:penicillin-binding protein 2 [Aliidongia sp.]
MSTQREQDRTKGLTRRAALLAGGQALLLSALVGRVYYLQVVEADRYKVLAEENRINLRLLAPRRGRLLDRFGVTLATSDQNYRVVLVAEQAGEIESTLDAIGTLVPLSDADKRRVLRDIHRKHSFVPVIVRENMSWEEVSRIEVNVNDLPGVNIEVGSSRFYPFGERVTHVVGYVAPPSEKELTGDPIMELPDFRIGKSGVEKSEDLELRGKAGASQIEVNALGRVVREINRDEGVVGQDVVLTLDMWLQDFTQRRLTAEESASCVLMDAVTGDILAMGSSPGYDGNAFTHGLPAKLWQGLNEDPHGPLNNKAIQGIYPPGSTFKPCVALAGLESGAITADTRISCSGKITVGTTEFHCWRKQGHGSLDLRGGLKNSCDVFFYEVARRLGVDKIAAMAHLLGMGKQTGVEIPSERSGLIPTRAWKLATYGVPWQNGETYSVGIGQGYVNTTPLQLATMVARLVTRRAVQPRIIRRSGLILPDKPFDPDAGASEFSMLEVDPKNLAAVLNGMDAVINEIGGTGYATRITEAGMQMGGKTGSAQVRHISEAERQHGLRKQEDIPWKDRDHALFIAFAPVGNPRYVAAAVVEHGKHGASSAGPIVRDVLHECQKRDPARQFPPGPLIVPDSAVVALDRPAPPSTPDPDPESVSD